MKAEFVDEIKVCHAFRKVNRCTCGNKYFDIIKQIAPETEFPWSVRCSNCGRETGQFAIKEGALASWRRRNKTV